MSANQLAPMQEPQGALHWGIILALMILYTVVGIAATASAWKVFVKAGHPGWAALVPIYNVYLLTDMVSRPLSFFFLTLIPGVGQVAGVLLLWDLFKAFGRPGWEALIPMYNVFVAARISFGNAQYVRPAPSL